MGFDPGQRGLHVGKLALDREGKRCDRAFHPFQDVDAQQVDQAFLAVHLAEEALAAANLGAVLGVVGRLLVRQHVPQRRVGSEVQAADFVVDFADRAELPGEVHVGLDVDRLESLRESARLVSAVVFLDVLARPGDGQQVEQLEVVEAEHVDEPRGRPFGIFQSEPAVELKLRLPHGRFDAGDSVFDQRHVVAFGDEGDLVLEVGEPVVDRRGREHQNAGLDAFLDDPAHQTVVARLTVIVAWICCGSCATRR